VSGERDLGRLLAGLSPHLDPRRWVFTRVPAEDVPADVDPVVTVRGREGVTLVVTQDDADRLGLPYDYVAAWITLEVHSALDAVGLTAAFSGALADAGLSCNVVAGYTHDHLFVPYAEVDRALRVLRALQG
jgi:uncharacterized protein